MKQWMKKTFAWVVALVMMLGCAMAAAEQTADLEALYPLMDLVCAAALDAQGEDDYAIVVPDSEGELTPEFVQAFIRIGQTRGESVGVTAAMMTDTAAQKTLLSSIFDAQLPELTAVTAADGESNYIGFRPVTVNNTGENNTLQIIGEIYTASKPLSEMIHRRDLAGSRYLHLPQRRQRLERFPSGGLFFRHRPEYGRSLHGIQRRHRGGICEFQAGLHPVLPRRV